MFGKFNDMMDKLREMKQKADEIKNKLDTLYVSVDDKYIRVNINGNRKISEIRLAEGFGSLLEFEMETRLREVLNRAIEAADKLNEEEMKKVAGGMLPGF